MHTLGGRASAKRPTIAYLPLIIDIIYHIGIYKNSMPIDIHLYVCMYVCPQGIGNLIEVIPHLYAIHFIVHTYTYMHENLIYFFQLINLFVDISDIFAA